MHSKILNDIAVAANTPAKAVCECVFSNLACSEVACMGHWVATSLAAEVTELACKRVC